jgi:uncharacterized repeat protein (TIGR01451 family)
VTMAPAASLPITVQYSTANNTATAGSDYVSIPLTTLTFNPGETSKTITVTINGDIDDEPNETFFVNLSNASGATISDAQGVGTIVDDDPNADVSVTKTDGVATATPGQVLTYTIVVANAGPNNVAGVTVTDTIPVGLTGATWTCVAGAGASCGAANGAGNISQSVNLNTGSSLTFTVTATVDATDPGSVRNEVTVAVPGNFGEPNLANNTASDDDLLICDVYSPLLPDGRSVARSLANGGTAWYLASLREGSSYSVEAANPLGTGVPTVTVFSGADACSGASSVVVLNTTGTDARAGASSRSSFTATGPDTRYRIRVVNSTGSTLSYSMQVGETALFSPAWSTGGTSETYYSFQNTTNATVTGTLTLRDSAGLVLDTQFLSIAAGQAGATNTSAGAMNVPRNRTGTAEFSHNGPPGAINAHASIASFASVPPYVQVIRFQAVREMR